MSLSGCNKPVPGKVGRSSPYQSFLHLFWWYWWNFFFSSFSVFFGYWPLRLMFLYLFLVLRVKSFTRKLLVCKILDSKGKDGRSPKPKVIRLSLTSHHSPFGKGWVSSYVGRDYFYRPRNLSPGSNLRSKQEMDNTLKAVQSIGKPQSDRKGHFTSITLDKLS